jgi:prepilin-type N-terminal cleavage/methylation domain-containing protein
MEVKLLKKNGFSLVEILVVLGVFAVLAALVTQSIFLTLRGSRKSESVISVRENLDYALNIMERHIYNSKSVNCVSATQIEYLDEQESGVGAQGGVFACLETASGGDPGYIASASAGTTLDNARRLTSTKVDITSCSFVCNISASQDVPDSVDVSLTAESAESVGAEGAQVTVNTKFLLRYYQKSD